jgi:hypothetical protein
VDGFFTTGFDRPAIGHGQHFSALGALLNRDASGVDAHAGQDHGIRRGREPKPVKHVNEHERGDAANGPLPPWVVGKTQGHVLSLLSAEAGSASAGRTTVTARAVCGMLGRIMEIIVIILVAAVIFGPRMLWKRLRKRKSKQD